MNSTIGQMIKDMEHGVYDFTKNGECSQCGACCSSLLPMTDKELRDLKKYVRKHHIKPVIHCFPTVEPAIDFTCPFRDDIQRKCLVYEARPEICRKFRCDKPKKHIRGEIPGVISDYRIVNMRTEKWGAVTDT